MCRRRKLRERKSGGEVVEGGLDMGLVKTLVGRLAGMRAYPPLEPSGRNARRRQGFSSMGRGWWDKPGPVAATTGTTDGLPVDAVIETPCREGRNVTFLPEEMSIEQRRKYFCNAITHCHMRKYGSRHNKEKASISPFF